MKKEIFSHRLINMKYFLISLAIGLFYVYIMSPPKKVIVVYPSPDKADTQYIDQADNCYLYKATEVTCPSNKGDISKIPSQQVTFE